MQIAQATLEHLRKNVEYPATGEQIIRACDMMAQVPLAERQFPIERINSRKLYLSATDVLTDMQTWDGSKTSSYESHAGPYVRFSRPQLRF